MFCSVLNKLQSLKKFLLMSQTQSRKRFALRCRSRPLHSRFCATFLPRQSSFKVGEGSSLPVGVEKREIDGNHRSRGNQRLFLRDILHRIATIRVAQRLGFSLSEISALLEPIPAGTNPSAAAVRNMIANWRTALQARIDGLMKLRENLDGCIGCGCLSLEDCQLRNPSDQLGIEGERAVLLQTP